MARADDEHTSTNEPEKDTSTQSSFLEKLKFWKRCKQEDDKPARLTAMPPCLMKWWTPLLVAFVLFVLSFISALGWGWQRHWPSSNAMKLCMTITGAGLAFSAWQQRSHDNAAKAKQTQATIERDDYWKRREHIFQLLGSKNPGLRLGAVALLAELADSAAHSTLLNETEKQQLQHHIIDTLCLQVRHEGLNQTHEGSQNERAEIQRAILDAIKVRINCNNTKNGHTANWSTNRIRLTDTRFLTPITIDDITTHSTIDLSNSELQQILQIKNSKLKHVIWKGTAFNSGVKIGEMDKPVTIEIDEIPRNSNETTFRNATLITSNQTLTIKTNYDIKEDTPPPSTRFIKCTFLSKQCPCPSECDCHISNIENECKCRHASQCICPENCTESHIELIDQIPPQTPTRGASYSFDNCRLNAIKINLNNVEVDIKLIGNRIRNGLHIQFHNTRRADTQPRYPYIYHADGTTISPNLVVQGNIFRVNGRSIPISISYNIAPTLSTPYIPALFDKNYITKTDTFEESCNNTTSSGDHLHTLHCEHNQPNISQFYFMDAFSEEPKDQWITSWTTGNSISEH
ncbi:hypothetical protein [Actinomyces sp.]